MIRWLFTRGYDRDGFQHDRSPAGMLFDCLLAAGLLFFLAFALFGGEWLGLCK